MKPPAEMVHWLFATGMLLLGLCLLSEAIVGQEVWRRRWWRVYLWPGLAFFLGLALWPVMVLFTRSAIHMLAHGAWAQVLMAAGAAELGLARGKLKSPLWRLMSPLACLVTGTAFLVHEQNGWFFQRSAFLHHALGWTFICAAIFPLGRVFRPRSPVFGAGFALSLVVVAVLLYTDRDVAPIFGHISSLAGTPRR